MNAVEVLTMKLNCPRCGGHVYADGLTVGQKAECPVCRHRFPVPNAEPSELLWNDGQNFSIPSAEIDEREIAVSGTETTDEHEQLINTMHSETLDRPRLATGLTVTAWSWALLFVSTTLLVLTIAILLANNRLKPNALAANELVYQAQAGFTLLCGMAYVWGQWLCYSACQRGGVLRLAMKKTLRNWGFAAATRLLAFALAFPPLRIVGAVFAARSFTAFMAFLSILAWAVDRPDLAQQVHAMDRLYRRSLGLSITLVVIALLIRPGIFGLMMVLAGAAISFVIAMSIFACRKTVVLIRLSAQLRLTSCQKGRHLDPGPDLDQFAQP